MSNAVSNPQVQVIPAGPLVVVNGDPVLHNTHGHYGKRTAFNMALPNEGQRIPTELKRAGTVCIDCDAHGWMEGWIYVVDNPYYAVTGADGKFTITDVPPGNYKLVAVQSLYRAGRDARNRDWRSVHQVGNRTEEIKIEDTKITDAAAAPRPPLSGPTLCKRSTRQEEKPHV